MEKISTQVSHQQQTSGLAYAGLAPSDNGWIAVLLDVNHQLLEELPIPIERPTVTVSRISRAFEECAKRLQVKIVGCGIPGPATSRTEALGTKLWLTNDIVPHFLNKEMVGTPPSQWARQAAKEVATAHWEKQVAKVVIDTERSVIPAALTNLEAYQMHATGKRFRILSALAQNFRDHHFKLIFISSTPNGGGVALMRHALIRLSRLLGIQVEWHVLLPDLQVFEVTKTKFHNILQGVAGRNNPLLEQDKKRYNAWIAKNAALLEPVYRNAQVVVIDDPQPSGLIPYIKKANPQVKIIYRSHIQIRADLLRKKQQPQIATWSFLKKNILQTDLFVSHPIKAFLPDDVPLDKVVAMPATTDPLDGLNKPLSKAQIRYYQGLFNTFLVHQNQKPLSLSRPYIIQVARFDPSKGIPDVVEAYRRFRKRFADLGRPLRETPQLVIMGNGAIDDPEGKLILDETFFLLEMDRYKSIAADIKVLQVPHIDQLLNAMLRGSSVALQLSHREGFEVKVTEAISKGIPVIAYRTGGIPLQIRSGVNGLLIKTGDTKQVAEALYRYFTDAKWRAKLKAGALATPQAEFWTIESLIRWLYLAFELAAGRTIAGRGKRVEELMIKQRKK